MWLATPPTLRRTPCRMSGAPHDPEFERQVRKKVQLTAEMEAPLRQARLLFLYPTALASVVINAVSSELMLARSVLHGDEAPSLQEAAQMLLVSAGIAAVTVWAQRRDQRVQAVSLIEIAQTSPYLREERAQARVGSTKLVNRPIAFDMAEAPEHAGAPDLGHPGLAELLPETTPRRKRRRKR
jgi:hypothetical protein